MLSSSPLALDCRLVPSIASTTCSLEPNFHYSSLWNETSLRVCSGPPRRERICIVGGGVAGVHLGWLLHRRLFTNLTIFEANSRLGGDVWTREATKDPADNITRELGAAFLSPDYFEVRALLARFGQRELPLSTRTQLQFHSTSGAAEVVQEPSEWANDRVAQYTNTTNATYNAQAVQEALSRYLSLHQHIFVRTAALGALEPALSHAHIRDLTRLASALFTPRLRATILVGSLRFQVRTIGWRC